MLCGDSYQHQYSSTCTRHGLAGSTTSTRWRILQPATTRVLYYTTLDFKGIRVLHISERPLIFFGNFEATIVLVVYNAPRRHTIVMKGLLSSHHYHTAACHAAHESRLLLYATKRPCRLFCTQPTPGHDSAHWGGLMSSSTLGSAAAEGVHVGGRQLQEEGEEEEGGRHQQQQQQRRRRLGAAANNNGSRPSPEVRRLGQQASSTSPIPRYWCTNDVSYGVTHDDIDVCVLLWLSHRFWTSLYFYSSRGSW